ncbi:MAG TPA: arylsulfatase, partial [Tichowtungia sp.]|nr:arylsulfatase [Tichowtungia sp.]
LADDLGYGDVQCLNPERGKIKTPNLDEFASQGMVFTDAHSTSSVCTPTRYSLLTGRYNWRSRLQQKIVYANDPPLINRERLTVGELLQKQGYATGCVGKWHLGFNWGRDAGGEIDYSKPFTGGPTERGFDWFFGMNAPGAPPHGFLENDRLIGEPSTTVPPEMRLWGSAGGPMVPGFTFESMLPTLTDKACEFIKKNASENTPFFLYYALSAPHTPLTPNKEWIGSSGLGQYADFVQELDFEVGRVIDAIDRAGIRENTLVIFTSDNGCTPMVGTLSELDTESEFERETVPGQEELFGDKRFTKRFTTGRVLELNAKGHYPSANLRGYKSDTWDGGHRVPFMVRWPGRVEAGTQCDRLVSLMDFMATCADLFDVPLPPDAAEDSVSLLPVFQNPDQSVRDSLVHHSFLGKFAIREGKWKLMLSPGSGGWWPPRDEKAREMGLPPVQLYDMQADIGEQHNLQAEHPEVVERMTKLLEKFVADGRSTPGPEQANDVPVDIWKKQD